MAPWLADPDVTLWHGDCLDVLRELPSSSVHMVATSPPFYGLRDYGVEGQIGLEETPDQWVARLVEVFHECRRVLRDDGTLWVEIGDSYAASGPTNHGTAGRRAPSGTKPKDLLGQPWLLAFALRADGWYLRSEIIWARPNPMPESVTDRPTKSHSTIFLLSKSRSYFFDADAIRQPHQPPTEGRNPHGARGDHYKLARDGHTNGEGSHPTAADGHLGFHPAGANARSVWTIPTEPTPFAHFATWPRKLVARMIQAGCPQDGIVLDPFGGSGTTALVARQHGRRAILIELNEAYCKIAADRLSQLSLLAEGTA